VEGSPYLYYKPLFQDGRWFVRRRRRDDVERKLEALKLPHAEDLAEAIDEAKALANEDARKAAEAAKPPEDRSAMEITLEDLWKRWTTVWQGLETRRDATIRLHETAEKKILAHFGEKTMASTVTLADIEAFFAGLRTAPARRRPDDPPRVGRSGRTLLFYVQKLKGLFEYAEDHGHVARSPLARFKTPKAWREDARAAAHDSSQALTVEELRTLISAAREPFKVDFTPTKLRKKLKKAGRKAKLAKRTPPPHLALAITIAALSGLRLGNIIGKNGIRWSDLDLAEGKERLRIGRDRMKVKPKRMDDRGKEEFFQVPINAELAEILRAERKKLRRVPKKLDRVVGDIDEFTSSWRGALKRAGLEERRVRFHDLRHSYSSILAAYTDRDFIVSLLLDHSVNRSTTARYAQHVLEDMLREAVNKLPRLTGQTGFQAVDKRTVER
jgi:integrase